MCHCRSRDSRRRHWRRRRLRRRGRWRPSSKWVKFPFRCHSFSPLPPLRFALVDVGNGRFDAKAKPIREGKILSLITLPLRLFKLCFGDRPRSTMNCDASPLVEAARGNIWIIGICCCSRLSFPGSLRIIPKPPPCSNLATRKGRLSLPQPPHCRVDGRLHEVETFHLESRRSSFLYLLRNYSDPFR